MLVYAKRKRKHFILLLLTWNVGLLDLQKYVCHPEKTEDLSFAKIAQLCALSMTIQFTEILHHPHNIMLLVVVLENLYIALKKILTFIF